MDEAGGAGGGAGAGAAAVGAEEAQPAWCEVNTPFSEDHIASGTAWLDEPKKYGPPLVAILGVKNSASGEGRTIVGDGSIAAAVAYLQSNHWVVPSEVLAPAESDIKQVAKSIQSENEKMMYSSTEADE